MTRITENGKTNERSNESGYVLATTALLLIPLMIFAALAVDVGGWYSRANQVQRASDAAALAAVIWMPDEPKATIVALETAKQNGFDATDPDVDVQVQRVSSQSIRVDITAKGDTYFGGVVQQDDVNLHRFATAEYILPVLMGNPSSALGTGQHNALIGSPSEGIFLAANAVCSGRSQGDNTLSKRQGSSWTCPSSDVLNPQFKAEGYNYIIDFPEGAMTQAWTVEFFEPGVCGDNSAGRTNREVFGGQGTQIESRLYEADDTQISDDDNIRPDNIWPAIDTSSVRLFGRNEGCNSTVANRWIPAYQIPSGARHGRWVLNVRTRDITGESGINYYAIRVTPSTSIGTVCTTLGGVNLDTCPRLSAKDQLSVYAMDKDGFDSTVLGSGVAIFYLAEIGSEHAGKKLEVTFFDPGEGMADMQILAPNGNPVAFTYETIDQSLGIASASDTSSTGNSTCSGSPCLDVSGSVFNNRTVRILVDLPASDAGCVGANCWWRVRYNPGSGTVTDRTVWSVRVIGDPVRLTE